ncbi:hypothetical protein [Streptomyces sp. NPDC048606]|uniref:hypothetical protein n=1 Tax=Streptomyces sp. NPDC048606 TaxID=3154726 RepID=UPI0034395FB8
MTRRAKTTKTKRPPFGIPREIVLMAGRDDEWPYTFRADGSGGGCGKLRMPTDAAVEDVQRAASATLADLTRTHHGVDIDVEWSPLPPDAWAGRIRLVAEGLPHRDGQTTLGQDVSP